MTGHQFAWVKWLYLGEFCYNTMHHMSIRMTPFRALYGYEATSFMDLLLTDSRVPSVGDMMQQNVDIMRSLKENLLHAENQQKLYADRKRTEKVFEVDDMVYLRLQPSDKLTSKGMGQRNGNPDIMGHIGSQERLQQLHMNWSCHWEAKLIMYSMFRV